MKPARWTHRFEHITEVSPEQLWPVLADVARWPEVDRNIDWLRIAEAPAPGVRFVLKPKGGPKLHFTIGSFAAPGRYSDICQLPFARMHTRHTLQPQDRGTRIQVEIEIEGPLAIPWGWIVGRRHAAGLPAQTERFIAGARARSMQT